MISMRGARQRAGAFAFRVWARRVYKHTPRAELSPKLARIVHGQE